MNIFLKSVYRFPEEKDGKRFLIETLWPEERQTADLVPYAWIHEVCPSYLLRHKAIEDGWGNERFCTEYHKELSVPWREMFVDDLRRDAEKEGITLLFSPTQKYIAASFLRDYLLNKTTPNV